MFLQPIKQHLSEFWDVSLPAYVCDLVWSGCNAAEKLLSHSNESILHPDTHTLTRPTHTHGVLDGWNSLVSIKYIDFLLFWRGKGFNTASAFERWVEITLSRLWWCWWSNQVAIVHNFDKDSICVRESCLSKVSYSLPQKSHFINKANKIRKI